MAALLRSIAAACLLLLLVAARADVERDARMTLLSSRAAADQGVPADPAPLPSPLLRGSATTNGDDNATETQIDGPICDELSQYACCHIGVPCDCTADAWAPGQCDAESYEICCEVGEPCFC